MNTNTCGCTTTDCSCKVIVTTDCVTLAENLTCSNILKGQTQTEVLKQLDTYICQRFESVTSFFTLINLGGGSELYKGSSPFGKKEFRTLIDSGLINLVQGVDTITISVDEAVLNTFIEANQKTYSTLNSGIGAQVYKSATIVGDNTQFNLRKIKSSDSSVSIVEGLDDINITVAPRVIPDGSETKVTAGSNTTVTGTGTTLTPYIVSGLLPPVDKIRNSYFPRGRNELQFGDIGTDSFDFTDALLGAGGDVHGQVGQIGVHPTEQYGALGNSCVTFGFNVSAQGYGDTIFGALNHSDIRSQFSTVIGRNNYNNSYNTLISGSYNIVPYTYLGHKTVFGNGNVANGSVSLTSGVALINRSFGTTVLGQANLDYANSEQSTAEPTAPLLIVGNGSVNVPVGLWTAVVRSNAFVLLRNGLATLPSVTNALITADASGKALITKEFLASNVVQDKVVTLTGSGATSITGTYPNFTISSVNTIADGSETKINSTARISKLGTGTTADPYLLNVETLQKVITYPADFAVTTYTLSNADNNHEIIINNGATAVTISVPAGLVGKIGVGFTQKGTGDVNYLASGTGTAIQNPIGLKIKGQYYQTYLSQELATNNYFLGGDTKV